jgi:NitT/TauT family transport system permease protein
LNKSFHKFFLPLLPAIVILAGWQFFIWNSPDREFFVGSPLGIWKELKSLWNEQNLLWHIGVTTFETVLGFLTGTFFGTVIGLLFWFSDSIYKVAKPYLILLGSLPVFALGPILIFWFGTGIISKIAIGFLVTVIIALFQAYTGAKEADEKLLVMMYSFGASKWRTFLTIVAPSSIIWVLSGIRINISMALTGAFVGEFISSNEGLGHLIIVAEGLFNVNQIWAGIIGLITIALTLNYLTLPVEKWANRWK